MDKKIAVFIDGANVYAASKMLGFDIDYARLKNFFGDHLVVANYYTAVKPRDKDVVDDLRPLLDWLEYNGYKVVSKPVKQYVAADGNTKTKGNMDAEMIVDMLELAPRVTDIWLFSGDGDFSYVVSAIQRHGVRVTVCSTIQSTVAGHSMPVCSDELRRTTNAFVDLVQLRDRICREVKVKTGSKYA